MVKRNPRRPSSASPTSRPRKVAGRDSAPVSAEAVEEVEEAQTPTVAPLVPPGPEPAAVLEPEPDPGPKPEEAEATRPGAGVVGSPKTTRVLLGVVAALAVLSLGGGIFLLVHDDDDSSTASDTGSTISADAETPVRITGEDAQLAVAQAAQAAYTIVATSYEDYDAQVDEAAELMTPTFAEDYRQTAADVEDAIIAGKTEVQVTVVAQGVVRADQEQVQALVFLNMYTTKNGKAAVFTPYRVLVTVVNTDQGWLVSDLETK